jgi:LruC domain-containing protein
MLRSQKSFIYLVILLVSVSAQSCLKDDYNALKPSIDYTGFEFKTVKEYDVKIETLNRDNLPIKHVYIELFTSNPLDENGLISTKAESYRIFKGITNNNGVLEFKINPPQDVDSIYALTFYIGLPVLKTAGLTSSKVEIIIEENSLAKESEKSTKGMSLPIPRFVNGYYVLGDWNNYGIPNYLESANDLFDNTFLADVNASLPERVQLPVSHPQYLENNNDGNLSLIEECEIWVTFVAEGAGWYNSLGYYTYPTNNPPSSLADITNKIIIFPNVTADNNTLVSGNKVQLYYLDKESNTYSSTFPEGITVGWFLVAQGWSSSSKNVGSGYRTHYSNVNLNVETNPGLKKHNVILYDDVRDILLLGFEDMPRDQTGCDHDFNDAVFYATANPITAIDLDIYQPIDRPTDTDGDGVTDVFDEYPDDAGKAFNNYYPSKGEFGTLIFEDLWPNRGDYDFNDLVLEYNYNQITNAQNMIVSISSRISVTAIGASYHNAFGIELNTLPENILSVIGQRNTKGYLNIAPNGTERNQAKATIIFFDDAYNVLPYPGTGLCVNTYIDAPYVVPDTFTVNISFANPLFFSDIGTPPYNPFIIINQNRGKEVHLPNNPPTSLADKSLFGTGNDKSKIHSGIYYVSDYYLPWAINIPTSFDYPFEKIDITKAYVMFNKWAGSKGANYVDWYQEKPGYRDSNKIYHRK